MKRSVNDLLSADHSKLDELLNSVFVALRITDCQGAFGSLDLFWARLAMHIRAEHLHLFPTLLRSIPSIPRASSVTVVIGQLRADHDHFMRELSGSVQEMRELVATGNAEASPQLARVTKRLEDLRDRLHAHNELEEAEIYPLVALMVEPAKRDPLKLQIEKELENLPPRFIGRSNVAI